MNSTEILESYLDYQLTEFSNLCTYEVDVCFSPLTALATLIMLTWKRITASRPRDIYDGVPCASLY